MLHNDGSRPAPLRSGLAGVLALVLAAAITAWSGSARAEDKLAFVVGINAYENLRPEFQLERPAADAEAVATTLGSLGFKVTLLTEKVTQETLLRRFTDFTAKIQPGDMALFYFAGHGIALENTNYLLPSDIPALEAGQELLARTRALAETDVREMIRSRGARVVVMVIDACRDNPFPRSGTRGLGMTRGLLPAERADGVFTLYSASLGQQALDRLPGNDPDPNSVFTRIFVQQLRKPGQNLIDLGESVRDEVATLVEGAHLKQTPAYYTEVRGARRVFLAGPGVGAQAALEAPAPPRVPTPRPSPPAPIASPPPPRPEPAPTPRAAPAPAPAPVPDRRASLPPPARPLARYSYLTGLDPHGDNWLALRSEPHGRGVRLMKMGPETLLTVTGRDGDWVQVRLATGETGWAFARFVACCREVAR